MEDSFVRGGGELLELVSKPFESLSRGGCFGCAGGAARHVGNPSDSIPPFTRRNLSTVSSQGAIAQERDLGR